MRRPALVAAATAVVLAACAAGDGGARGSGAAPVTAATAPESVVQAVPTPARTPLRTAEQPPPPARPVDPRHLRPAWLGTRPLTDDPTRRVTGLDTPPELVDRQLLTIDRLPPPPDDAFRADVRPLSDEVVARSTWREECPVARTDLAHVVVTHWGFDGWPHTGELIVHATVAHDIVWVFEQLHAARYPIEQLGIASMADLEERPPTGDGNGSGAFVCRNTVGSSRWSQHAYGLAIDINPFHNPYVRNGWVIPELAAAYLDREALRTGMIQEGDPVVTAFDAIGWQWGGRWNSAKDWMHFSANGR